MNNEPSDDLLAYDGRKTSRSDVDNFAGSWTIAGECGSSPYVSRTGSEELTAFCEAIFSSKVSPFVTCFSRVSNGPFLDMCLNSTSTREACAAAVAYTNLCSYANTPVTIPDSCIK